MASFQKRPAPTDDVTGGVPVAKKARHDVFSALRGGRVQDSSEESTASDVATTCSPALYSFAPTEPSLAETSKTSHGNKREKRFICDFDGCAKAFDRPARLEIHIRSHTNDRPFPCTYEGCGKSFLRTEHLKAHVKGKHSTDREFVCTYPVVDAHGMDTGCRKSFPTATKLRRHVAAHEEKEQTRCTEPACRKVFRKQETLQRHIKRDHLHEAPFTCMNITSNNDGSTEVCGQDFATAGRLKGHQAREHSGSRYFCDICPSTEEPSVDHGFQGEDVADLSSLASALNRIGFATYAELQQHARSEHPPTCSDCGKQCKSNRALRAHVEIEHSVSTDKPHFPCCWSGCDRSFTKAGNLKVHLQNVHARKRDFVCGYYDLSKSRKVEGWNGQGCGAALATKASLEQHIRTQHLGLANNIRPSKLKKMAQRQKKAGEEMPSTFMDVDELAKPRHIGACVDDTALTMLTGHGYEAERPLVCLVTSCVQRFSNEWDLAPHLELTHGWHIDDVNEALASQPATRNDKFWIGGEDGIEQPEFGDGDMFQIEDGSGNGLSALRSEEQRATFGRLVDPTLMEV